MNHWKKSCSWCDGTGKVKYMTLPVACPVCNGAGYIDETYKSKKPKQKQKQKP